jgi:hypothetical protein
VSISLEIRRVLAESDTPLSVGEIRARLTVECQNLPSALRERVLAGEMIRHHSTAGLRYSLNPDWCPKKKGAPPKLAKSANVAPPPEKAPPASGEFAVLADAGRATEAEIDAFNARPPVVTPKPSDFDLHRRLDAIGTDLADAIADACDAEHPHGLIKALVVSREAVARAQAALPR